MVMFNKIRNIAMKWRGRSEEISIRGKGQRVRRPYPLAADKGETVTSSPCREDADRGRDCGAGCNQPD